MRCGAVRCGAVLARLCFALSECTIIIFTWGGWRPPPVDWVHPIDGPASRCRHRRRRRHLPSPPLGSPPLPPHHLPPFTALPPHRLPPSSLPSPLCRHHRHRRRRRHRRCLLPPPPPPPPATLATECRRRRRRHHHHYRLHLRHHRLHTTTALALSPSPPARNAHAGSGRPASPPFYCRRHCRSVPRLIIYLFVCSSLFLFASLRLRVVCDLSMLLYISFCVYGAGSCSIVSSALQSIIIFTLGARSLNI